jgi:hypothetical protein
MSDIKKLTKAEMANYLYVRDIVRGNQDSHIETFSNSLNNTENIRYMLYVLPILLLIISGLVFYLVYTGKKEDKNDE